MDDISDAGRSGGAASPRPAHDLAKVGQSKSPSETAGNPTECPTGSSRVWTQDEIDEEMLANEDLAGDDEREADMNCGKYPGSNGCSLAGTEWCDWSCPYSR